MKGLWASVCGNCAPSRCTAGRVTGVGAGRSIFAGGLSGRDIKRETGRDIVRYRDIDAGAGGGGTGRVCGGGAGTGCAGGSGTGCVGGSGAGGKGGTPCGDVNDHSMSAWLGGYVVLTSKEAPMTCDLSALTFTYMQYDLHSLQQIHILSLRMPNHLDSIPHPRWHITSSAFGSVVSRPM